MSKPMRCPPARQRLCADREQPCRTRRAVGEAGALERHSIVAVADGERPGFARDRRNGVTRLFDDRVHVDLRADVISAGNDARRLGATERPSFDPERAPEAEQRHGQSRHERRDLPRRIGAKRGTTITCAYIAPALPASAGEI